MTPAAHKSWFSADELAALDLPGLSSVKRRVNVIAREQGWATATTATGKRLSRPRRGRGGGLEYHLSVLPAAARAELARRTGVLDHGPQPLLPAANDQAVAGIETRHAPLWDWFDRQSDKVKAEAARRLKVVDQVEAFGAAGMTRTAAVAQAAAAAGVGPSTLWQWLDAASGVAREDRMPALAPRRKGGGAEVTIEPTLWQEYKSDWLRPSKPTHSACYRRLQLRAEALGMALPSAKTLQRKIEREVPREVIILKREGEEALRRSMPSQKRTVEAMHAMALVNIDGHKFDVFVRDAAGNVFRPIMVAIQDVFSRKMLSWRIGDSESAILTRLAFADLFRDHGIPEGCLLDNGRAFASKWITGGVLNRFRFKVREEEPTCVLPAMGVKVHWATPHRGQSKPIERAFGDLNGKIAKHPACQGAYTGNSPMAKPDDYGTRAVELDAFLALVAEQIAIHNAQAGRRTETANGRSFDQVYAESIERVGKRVASAEQLRLALLTGENVRVDRRDCAISFMGNRYWSAALGAHAGAKVTVRFDPDDLHAPLHVYDLAGRYVGEAACIADTGFLDAEAAKTRKKAEKRWRDAAKEQAAAQQLLAAADLASRRPALIAPEPIAPAILRPVRPSFKRGGGQHAAALAAAAVPAPIQEADDVVERFSSAVLRLVEDE